MLNKIPNKTRIKVKLKKSEDQMNIDIYGVAANITEYHIISKLIFQRIIIKNSLIEIERAIKTCLN